MSESSPLRILVADDHPVRTRVLLRLLRGDAYNVRGVVSGEECWRALGQFRPHLVLLDVVLPDGHGVEICRRIKQSPHFSEVRVLLFSSIVQDTEHQADGLEAGADGYVAWPVGGRELLARIRLALRGTTESSAAAADLTPRQIEVVRLIAAGLTSKQVAGRLGIALRTAETHRAAIMRRLGLHSTADLVGYAWRHGLGSRQP